jgi:hypothetical protein
MPGILPQGYDKEPQPLRREETGLFTFDAVFQGLLGEATVGWIEAEFSFADRDPLPVMLTVVLAGRQIAHYHVSRT